LKISVLIPYRGRNKEVVKNCLEALQNQSLSDYEVILLDYGSTQGVSEKIETLCTHYSKVRYIYSDARGYFWSCSQAFNQALYHAKGEYLVMLDIDLVVPRHFLNFALGEWSEENFLIFKVFYLPPRFTDWQGLRSNPERYMNAEKSEYGGLGNIFVLKKHLQQTGGYDTFYRFWGEEDIDMARKLNKIGLEAKIIQPESLPIFHQWHPKVSDYLPKGWQATILAHSKEKNNHLSLDSLQLFDGQPITKTQERPVLELLDKKTWKEKDIFNFKFPVEHSYVSFIRRFNYLKSGEFLYISQTFSEVQPQKGSRLGKFLKKTNLLLKRLKISYRWVEIAKLETEIIYSSTIADYLFYFLLDFEAEIADYYFENQEESVFLVVIKK
jgi:glycosyltransferase involved in cell wall biosynthesis